MYRHLTVNKKTKYYSSKRWCCPQVVRHFHSDWPLERHHLSGYGVVANVPSFPNTHPVVFLVVGNTLAWISSACKSQCSYDLILTVLVSRCYLETLLVKRLRKMEDLAKYLIALLIWLSLKWMALHHSWDLCLGIISTITLKRDS